MNRIVLGVAVLAVVGVLATAVFFTFTSHDEGSVACSMEAKMCPDGSAVSQRGPRCEFAPCPAGRVETSQSPPGEENIVNQSGLSTDTKQATTPVAVSPEYIDDSASTLASPTKILASDGKHYFIFGQPKGQNSQLVKKIIFSLPGHESTAEEDYAAWKPQITDNDYALASVNWWDGVKGKTADYYQPEEVDSEIRDFLSRHGYVDKDFVVLEGFSRGSANTYAVKAYDILRGTPVIDAIISASGRYQSDFAMTPQMLNMNGGKIFENVPWVLACGVKDPSPTLDGCGGMSETKAFLIGKGANVLGLLEDPNGGHGAFHMSSLKLVDKALKLLDSLPESKE